MNAIIDTRAQLLANLRFLYGPTTEILTFCRDAKYQAVALSFDPLTKIWTKFLHSEPGQLSASTITSLLEQSEVELARLFEADGHAVPFLGDRNMVQTLNLHRGLGQARRNNAGNGDSLKEEFEFVDTPGSPFPDDTVREEPIEEELPIEKAPAEEVVDFMVEDEATKPEQQLEEPQEFEDTAAPELDPKDPVEESVMPDPEPEPPVEDLGWGSFRAKKGKGKKGKVFVFEEMKETESAPEPEPAFEIVSEVLPEPDVDRFGWGFKASKKEKKKKGKATVLEPAPTEIVSEVILEPEFDGFALGFGKSKKDKKKRSKAGWGEVEEHVKEPETEPEPAVEESYGWGLLGAIEEPTPELETEPAPPVEDDSWANWGIESKKDKKKKKGVVFDFEEPKADEVPLTPEEEPKAACDDDSRGSLTTSKKKKRKNYIMIEEPTDHSLAQLSDPVLAIEHGISPVAESSEEPTGSIMETSLAPDPTPRPTSTHTTTLIPGSAGTQCGQTVVLTIQYPQKISIKPAQVMTTLANNTRAAIFDAVNAHLDSKSTSMDRPGLRKLEIMCGVGRNGCVDLSGLGEAMWPEYLEYFCQYTRLPELTIDVLDF